MAVHSGKTGYVTIDGSAESDVQDWTISDDANATAYGSSNTGGRKKRLAGTGDCTGSFTMLQVPSFDAGGTGQFVGHTGGITGGEIYTAEIFIETVTPNVNINDGTPSSWNVTFGGNGAFSHTTSA
jgi:hypothetical protein